MSSQQVVNVHDFGECLVKLRDLRAWAIKHHIDPFALRQAMILILEIEANHILQLTHDPDALMAFDAVASEYSKRNVLEMVALNEKNPMAWPLWWCGKCEKASYLPVCLLCNQPAKHIES